jgi:hypothetical protein
MNPANSYTNILAHLDSSHMPGVWMCGLLFAPPNTPVGRSIMDRLDDWHHRSGANFDFFCVGYVDWNEFEDDQPVGHLRDTKGSTRRQFYFSAKAFDDIRRNVEGRSGWRYSGEADLLLVNAVQDESRQSFSREWRPSSSLEFSEMLALDMDKIVNEKVYSSASRLMEAICRAADVEASAGSAIKVHDFSDKAFLRTLFSRSLAAVIEKLKLDGPLGARHFIVGAHLLERA